MKNFDLIDDNTYAKQIDDFTFEFVKYFKTKELEMDEEDVEYLAVGSTITSPEEDAVNILDWAKTPHSIMHHDKPITEAEAKLPFARCYFLFEESYFGNEDWNQGYSSLEEMRLDLLSKFNFDILELAE